jgi:transcriptional regulator with XRE-family HTH domain
MKLENATTIGHRIKICRLYHHKNLYMKDFCADLNIHPTVFSMVERGHRNPSKVVLRKLTANFKVTKDFLLFGDIDIPKWWNNTDLKYVLSRIHKNPVSQKLPVQEPVVFKRERMTIQITPTEIRIQGF